MSNAQKSFSLDAAGNPIPPDIAPKPTSPRVHRPSTPKSRMNNARNNAQKNCDRDQLRSLQDALGTGSYQTWANSDEVVEANMRAIAKWQAEMSSARAGLQEADKLSTEMGAISVSEGKEKGKESAKETDSGKEPESKEDGHSKE